MYHRATALLGAVASDAGSFADANVTVPTDGRTIVFAVSGDIRFSGGFSEPRMTRSRVTIAGRPTSSPGPA